MIEEFGKTIKNARLAKDLSLRDLAELTGIDHSYIGRLEKNSSIPSRETVAKLAKALNIPENELMIKAGYVPNTRKETSYTITGTGDEDFGFDKDVPLEVREKIRDYAEYLIKKHKEENEGN